MKEVITTIRFAEQPKTESRFVGDDSLSHTLSIYFGGQSPPLKMFYGFQ